MPVTEPRFQDIRALLCGELGIEENRLRQGPLRVCAPATGRELARLVMETPESLARRIEGAQGAQRQWASLSWEIREDFQRFLADQLHHYRETLALLVAWEGGKTLPEAYSEADGSVAVLKKTIEDAALGDLGDIARRKLRHPIGVVGLITSFNFPLAVANWTIAPAMLAGNAVIWKPSDKTPLCAVAYEAIFRKAAAQFTQAQIPPDLVQVAVCRRDVGQYLVKHEAVGMISATGSTGMGHAIQRMLAEKENKGLPPILELGGNNAVVISGSLKAHPELLERALNSLLNSAWGSAGQRCTDTRRLLVHEEIYNDALNALLEKYRAFLASGAIKNPLEEQPNPYGYGPLIDEDAFQRFEQAKETAIKEGAKLHFGERLLQNRYPQAYYVQPALVEMPEQKQGGILFEETFAPLLYVLRYRRLEEALEMVNAPANAGLVNGIYTVDKVEMEVFAQGNEAGHTVINMPRGTGTPAHQMGFGGNKDSGCGEILNAADPLRPFSIGANRIAKDQSFKA